MASFLPGFQAGAAATQGRLAREQREAEFRAEAAQRQLQERFLTQRIELAKQEEEQQIQMRADAEKAAAAMALDLQQSDIIEMAPGDAGPPQANPNKLSMSQAYVKNFTPFYARHRPQDMAQMFSTVARLEEADPQSSAIRAGHLQARLDEQDLERQRLAISKANLGMRGTGLMQGAVTQEATLAEKGFAPTVPVTPPVDGAPTGVAAGQPLIREIPRRTTQATVTAAQQGIQGDIQAISSLREAIAASVEHPEAFGFQGKVRKGVELVKGQLKPGKAMDTPITDTRQKAAKAFTDVAKSLKVDSQLNRDELVMVKDLGETLDITEAPQTAQNKMMNLFSWSLKSAIRKTRLQGKPIEPLLQQATLQSILDAVDSGDLTLEEAIAERNRRAGAP